MGWGLLVYTMGAISVYTYSVALSLHPSIAIEVQDGVSYLHLGFSGISNLHLGGGQVWWRYHVSYITGASIPTDIGLQ